MFFERLEFIYTKIILYGYITYLQLFLRVSYYSNSNILTYIVAKKIITTESLLVELINQNEFFTYKGVKFRKLICGKPRPKVSGECKTDIYVLGENCTNNERVEFKISVKQINAQFLENKMKLSRAIEIFGNEAQEIIFKSILQIKNDFINDYLIYFKNKGKDKVGNIKIGWKFEFLSCVSPLRSGIIILSESQALDVYAGTNL